jgi:hypothetical protein
MDVVKRRVLIGSATKLGSKSGGVSARRNLSQNSTLPTTTTRVVTTLQMVFTNPITTTHVKRTVDRPLMSSMAARRYRRVDVANLRGGYQKPFAIITQILDHKDGHYVRPNMVALTCPIFKKMMT